MFKTKRFHKFIALFISAMFIFSPLGNVLPITIYAQDGTDDGEGTPPASSETESTEETSEVITATSTLTSVTPSTSPVPTVEDGEEGGDFSPPAKTQEELDAEYINGLDSVQAIYSFLQEQILQYYYYYDLLTDENRAAVDKYTIYIEVNSFTDMAALDDFLNGKADEKAYYESFLTDDNRQLLAEYRRSITDKEVYNAEMAIVERIAGYISVSQLTPDDIAFLNEPRITAALADYLGNVYGITDIKLQSFADGKSVYEFVYKSNFSEGLIELIKASLLPNVRAMLDTYKAEYDAEMEIINRLISSTTFESFDLFINSLSAQESAKYEAFLETQITTALSDYLSDNNLTYVPNLYSYNKGEDIYTYIFESNSYKAMNAGAVYLMYAGLTAEQKQLVNDYISSLEENTILENSELSESEPYIPPTEFWDAGPVYVYPSSTTFQAAMSSFALGKSGIQATDSTTSEPKDSDGLITEKTVTYNSSTGKYDIELQAWTTGEVTTDNKSIPADIILVLDVSGSMSENITLPTGQYIITNDSNATIHSNYGSTDYYILDNGDYYKITNVARSGESGFSSGEYYYVYTLSNGSIYNGRSVGSGAFWILSWSDTLKPTVYVAQTQTLTKMQALKNSVNNFITQVNANAQANGVDHRIAIVTYSDSANRRSGLVDIRSNNGTLTSIINGLSANGATNTGAGMTEAVSIFANDTPPAGQRSKVVVLFTDGVPTTSTAFNDTVANNAISASNTLKGTYKATVFTIGIFSGANTSLPVPSSTSDQTQRANRFMHYVSSNYTPSSPQINGTITQYQNTKYYLTTGSTTGLNEIFQSIANSIATPSISLDSNTIIRDVLSDYFVLPTNFTNANVYVYTQNYNGSSFSGDQPLYPGATVTVDPTTRKVDVTGFDFNANFITNTQKPNSGGYGKKLIIRFSVDVNPDFLGGNNVPTNDLAKSGVFVGETCYENFELPTANVPIHYDIVLQDQLIYLSNSPGSVVASATALGGVNNKYVDIEFALYRASDLNTAIKNISIAAGAAYTEDEIKALLTPSSDYPTGDTEYVVKVTVTPTTGVGAGTFPAETENKNKAKVYVATPVITWSDISIDAGTAVTLKERQVIKSSTGNKIEWAIPTTAPTALTSISGTEPTLTYTFAVTPSAEITLEGKVSPTVETKVNVSNVKFGSSTINYMQYVTFKWIADTECDTLNCGGHPTVGLSTDDYTHSGQYELINGATDTHEFTIHIKSFTLIITKEAGAGTIISANESFIFKIVGPDGTFWEVVQGAGEKTIKNLPSGTYTVTEETDWSWRYTSSMTIDKAPSANGIFTSSKAQHEIVVTNTKIKNSWLSGDSWAVNTFSGGTVVPKYSPTDGGITQLSNMSTSSLFMTSQPSGIAPANLPLNSAPSLIKIPDAKTADDTSASGYSGVYARNVIRPRA